MKKSIYLSNTENIAMQLLAEGKRMREIRAATGFDKQKGHLFHVFLHTLRKKTGTEDIQSIPECSAYWAKVQAAELPPVLTKQQTRLMTHTIEQTFPKLVETTLGLSAEEIKTLLAETLVQCCITAKELPIIRMQLRTFFAVFGNPHSEKLPLSTTHWQILRAIAEGEDIVIATGLKLAVARKMARDACSRAEVLCPGRNARRKLVQTFLALHDPQRQPAVTMDDPMF